MAQIIVRDIKLSSHISIMKVDLEINVTEIKFDDIVKVTG